MKNCYTSILLLLVLSDCRPLSEACYAAEINPDNKGDLSAEKSLEYLARARKAESEGVTFVLINRGKGRFRISNHSKDTISFSTLYIGDDEDFTPSVVQYAVRRKGKWEYKDNSANVIHYTYRLKQGDSVEFDLPLDGFEMHNVSRGELVKVGVNHVYSTPFKW